MARNEQKLTLQSPLSLLSSPGTLQQAAFLGLPIPRDISRYSPARLAYSQRRDTKEVQSSRTPAGIRRHDLRSQNAARDGADTVYWVEGDRPKVGIAAELSGNV